MKIVVNRSYGGFSFSPEATKWLVENGDPELILELPEEDEFVNEGIRRIFDKHLINLGDGYVGSTMYNFIIKNRKAYSLKGYEEHRSHSDLIRCVELFGNEVNDYSFGDQGGKILDSNIKIVEIPDDVQWKIVNENGWETVHGKHRSWPST